jgi:membrane protein
MAATPSDTEPPARRRRIAQARENATRAAAWGRERLPFMDFVDQALERERIAAAGLLAGGLAYRLFFWIVPLGLVAAAILSFWVEADPTGLEDAAEKYGIGGATASSATNAIASGARARWYFLVVGLTLLPWFGIGVVRAINVAHAVAWKLPPQKLKQPLARGIAFTGITAALLAVSAGADALRERQEGPGLGLLLGLGVVYAAVMVWVSTFLPSRATGWRPFVPGAVLFGIGMVLVHLSVSIYFAPKLGRSTELYGALGAATVVLLWLYLAARLVVAGAFLNAALWDRGHPD